MKTLELNLPTPVLLVWGSPNGFMVYNGNNGYTIMPPQEDVSSINTFTQPAITVSPCWQLIGKLSDLTEEQAKEFDSGVPHHTTGKQIYRDHTYYTERNLTENGAFDTALESFHSAIEAEGYYIMNPY